MKKSARVSEKLASLGLHGRACTYSKSNVNGTDSISWRSGNRLNRHSFIFVLLICSFFTIQFLLLQIVIIWIRVKVRDIGLVLLVLLLLALHTLLKNPKEPLQRREDGSQCHTQNSNYLTWGKVSS